MGKLLRSFFGLRRGWVADLRIWALLVPAIAVLSLDLPVMFTLLYSLSAMLVIVALAHVMRRVVLPYLDLEAVENRASESPQGAGLVFLGVSLMIASFVVAAAIWIVK